MLDDRCTSTWTKPKMLHFQLYTQSWQWCYKQVHHNSPDTWFDSMANWNGFLLKLNVRINHLCKFYSHNFKRMIEMINVQFRSKQPTKQHYINWHQYHAAKWCDDIFKINRANPFTCPICFSQKRHCNNVSTFVYWWKCITYYE